MKSVLIKVGRFFWSWGFLKFMLGLVALIILIYVEEDWRGAHALAVIKAQWEAKGESFDYTKFFPPPVPDDQNLGAVPLFKLDQKKDENGNSYVDAFALKRAMRGDLSAIQVPLPGKWQQGELPDMAAIKNTVTNDYSIAFRGASPPDDALARFEAIYPFVTELVAASASRPLCRFDFDYQVSPPVLRSLGPITKHIKLSKILTVHAILALDRNQPDLALKDIEATYKLISGVRRDPTFIGGLVAMGMATINDTALFDGLARHAWTDSQLAQLQDIYTHINFLADYQFAMRSEAAESAADSHYFEHANRSELYSLSRSTESTPLQMIEFAMPSANGWWDSNLDQLVSLHFRELATVDPKLRLVYPQIDLELKRQVDQASARWDADAPWNIWFTIASPTETDLTLKYAHAQVMLDEARIACALERYRLAQGVYPESLKALAPAYIDEVPHDIMSGESYRYKVQPSGIFLLYSVGWDQTDDGGSVVYEKTSPNGIDYKQGDWVWPTPSSK